MSKWAPKEMHIFMGEGHLCGYELTARNWPEEYMSEPAGLYQQLPICEKCMSELKNLRKKRNIKAKRAAKVIDPAKPPKLVLWDYRRD
jgi:hypothetical protein